MIIFLNQNFKLFFLLPRLYKYFSTNPELNFKLKRKGYNVLDFQDFDRNELFNFSLDFQSKLLAIPKGNNNLSLNYYANFNYLKKKKHFIIKKKIENSNKEKVVFINQWLIHKNIKLFLVLILKNFNLSGFTSFFLTLLNLPFSIYKACLIVLKKYSLIDANKVVAENISKNFEIKNYFRISNVFDSKSFSIISFINLYAFLFSPFLILKTFRLMFNEKKLIRYQFLNFKNYFHASLFPSFSSFFRKTLNFKFYTLNILNLSESLINSGDFDSNCVINHGVHYFDKNKKLNLAWLFHSKTIFNNNNSNLISSNIFDKIFLSKNSSSIFYKYNKPFINYSLDSVNIDVSDRNNVLIADTFKDDNFLRPHLYHDAFQYIHFLKFTVNSLKNISSSIIIRHRGDAIISTNYLNEMFKNEPNVQVRSDGRLIDFFINDPVVISYSSTVIFESLLFNLRTISLDLFNSGMNFLNAPNFDKNSVILRRFFYKINSINDLKYLICKI
jgi:hypothetical protein